MHYHLLRAYCCLLKFQRQFELGFELGATLVNYIFYLHKSVDVSGILSDKTIDDKWCISLISLIEYNLGQLKFVYPNQDLIKVPRVN